MFIYILFQSLMLMKLWTGLFYGIEVKCALTQSCSKRIFKYHDLITSVSYFNTKLGEVNLKNLSKTVSSCPLKLPNYLQERDERIAGQVVTTKALFYPVQTRIAVQSLWASPVRPLLYLNSDIKAHKDPNSCQNTSNYDNSHGIRNNNRQSLTQMQFPIHCTATT